MADQEPRVDLPQEPENGSWVQVGAIIWERDDIARILGDEPNWFPMYHSSDARQWRDLVAMAVEEDEEIWLMGMARVERIDL